MLKVAGAALTCPDLWLLVKVAHVIRLLEALAKGPGFKPSLASPLGVHAAGFSARHGELGVIDVEIYAKLVKALRAALTCDRFSVILCVRAMGSWLGFRTTA